MAWGDPAAVEGDAFDFEAQALIERVAEAEADGAAGADDALPGQGPAVEVEQADDEAMVAGESGGGGDGGVAGDLAGGDGANDAEDGVRRPSSSPRLLFQGSRPYLRGA